MNAAIRVLHLEDSPLDQELVKQLLDDANLKCEITEVHTRSAFEEKVRGGNFDLILSDYSLPAFDGFSALKIAKKVCPTTPFIFVTGTLGEDNAVESLKHGATDYVLKQKLSRLGTAVRRALRERDETIGRLRAEDRLRESEEELRFLAYHDALTALPNRVFLLERLKELLGSSRRRGGKSAILFFDLDSFKNINDSLGHSIGDMVLKSVGERLHSTARSQDIVARLGGDEFVVVLNGIGDSTDAAMAAERINAIVASEIQLEDRLLFVTCSIGISVFPDDGDDTETLLKNADTAMFCAKEKGRNRWEFFTKDMNDRALERLTLENGLRVALAKDQFFLEYQPQVDISSRALVGVEALLRWRHPELGLIPPNRFISVAENTGEILRIGEWVMRTACAQAKRWQDEGLGAFPVSVNVSAVQFRHEGFLATVNHVLTETGLAPERLELELTESLLLACSGEMTSVVTGLLKMGVRLAIDDFGTGYSSFSYLRDYRFSKLKVDGTFVKGITTDSNDAAIAAAIVSMGKILRMKVIAECVETEQQLKMLRTCGCDEIQGYLVSRPVPASVLAEKLRSRQFWTLAGATIAEIVNPIGLRLRAGN
jgi:diguanylate cyclase (GGDEF)-like protein